MEVLKLQGEQLLRGLKFVCHDFWETYGDSRVSRLPLLGSGPWHVLTLTGIYLWFVKYYGPKWMKNREAFDLRKVMIFHNTFLVLLNGIGFLIAMAGTNFGAITLQCKQFNPDSTDTTDQILLYLGYTYYISKFIDFLDTIYFVLRKKDSHVTGLHVFHHTMMPFWCYIFFKFSTYTNNGFIPLVNAFIHTVMYAYYALAALGPHMAKYLWWKSWITILQLVQFVICTIHSLYMLFDTSCTCSKLLISFQAIHGILFFHLFYGFYKRTYNKNNQNKSIVKNSPSSPSSSSPSDTAINGSTSTTVLNGHARNGSTSVNGYSRNGDAMINGSTIVTRSSHNGHHANGRVNNSSSSPDSSPESKLKNGKTL